MIADIFDDYNIFENDIEEIINYVNPLRNYTIRPRIYHINKWDDWEFYDRFRLSKGTVLLILEQIEDHLQHRTNRNAHSAIQPVDQLLITLRFLATGTFYKAVGDLSHIHKSTTGRIISKVIRALARLRPNYIKFPETNEEKEGAMTSFYTFARFPRVLGAIDCTHIKLQSPGGENAEVYRNRKGWFSLNVQAVCSADTKIIDLVCRWPGSSHDTHIFNNSAIKMRFQEGEFENSLLLGDSGYPQRPYLLTPINNPQTEAEHLYNESQIRTRNVIERTFGIIKRRFPVLSMGMRCRIPLAQKITVACGVLHNIACDENEAPFEGADEEEDDPEDVAEEQNEGNDARDELIAYFQNLLNLQG